MPDPYKKISADEAVKAGLKRVYGVVVPILVLSFIGPLLLMGFFGVQGEAPTAFHFTALVSMFLATWCLAWIAWSLLVPRWRLWAYQRVDDIDELKREAVAAQLIWPDGHFFEKTEFVSSALRQELQRLERENRNRQPGVA